VSWLFLLVALSGAGLEPALGATTGTLVDLSDDWVPRILSDDPTSAEAGGHPYRAEFIRLANHPSNPDERFLELYGISPSVSVIAVRLLDETRHRCHAEAPGIALSHAGARALVLAAQAHLRCEGLLDRSPDGVLEGATATALRLYQREQAIIGSGALDAETREALATDSRELDFRALLRVLRERVVDATGVIEDGSALGRAGTVLGRRLECREMRWTDRLVPLPGGAPDLVSPLTEEAARALGWIDPTAAAAYFRRTGPESIRNLRVRLPLDSPPAYHRAEMMLRSEIITGGRRPELRLIARPDPALGADDIVLVRWPTTKGGWQHEKIDAARVVMKLKPSAMGSFVWRDLITAPAWFPPDTTPDEELIRKLPGGGFRANREAVGPGYRSAYGLVMLVHDRPPPIWNGEGSPPLYDAQTRTHGTASYRSVLHGESHGCHRLYSPLAIRLGSFLLAHRHSIRRGPIVAHYRRMIAWRGRRIPLRADTRGYLYELTPPVPVRVTSHDRTAVAFYQ